VATHQEFRCPSARTQLSAHQEFHVAALKAIRQVYQQLLADRPTFVAGDQQPALRFGDLALTSTRLAGGGATVEVARRQPDGTWLWVIDQPNVLG
jgi:hypothetical protein